MSNEGPCWNLHWLHIVQCTYLLNLHIVHIMCSTYLLNDAFLTEGTPFNSRLTLSFPHFTKYQICLKEWRWCHSWSTLAASAAQNCNEYLTKCLGQLLNVNVNLVLCWTSVLPKLFMVPLIVFLPDQDFLPRRSIQGHLVKWLSTFSSFPQFDIGTENFHEIVSFLCPCNQPCTKSGSSWIGQRRIWQATKLRDD